MIWVGLIPPVENRLTGSLYRSTPHSALWYQGPGNFLKTGKSTVVQVNDRGPFVPGRIIDISRAAAAEIGLQRYGVGKLRSRSCRSAEQACLPVPLENKKGFPLLREPFLWNICLEGKQLDPSGNVKFDSGNILRLF